MTDNIFSDAFLTTAGSSLSRIGVFADETRGSPGLPAIQRRSPELKISLQGRGYRVGDIEIYEVNHPIEGISYFIVDKSKITGYEMAEAIWYEDYRRRWHDKVAARVNDWLDRISALKANVAAWLPAGASIVERRPTVMNEDLMRRFGVSKVDQPTFDVARDSHHVLRFQPKGLWVIGANGRIDLTAPNASYILVDKADPESGSPDWQFFTRQDVKASEKFDEKSFLRILAAA